MTLIVNTNNRVSAINLYLRIMGKLGMMKVKKKTTNKNSNKPLPNHLQWLWRKMTLCGEQWIIYIEKLKEDEELPIKPKQGKYGYKPLDV